MLKSVLLFFGSVILRLFRFEGVAFTDNVDDTTAQVFVLVLVLVLVLVETVLVETVLVMQVLSVVLLVLVASADVSSFPFRIKSSSSSW